MGKLPLLAHWGGWEEVHHRQGARGLHYFTVLVKSSDIWLHHLSSGYTIGLLTTPLDIWLTSDYTTGVVATPHHWISGGLLSTPLVLWLHHQTSDYTIGYLVDFWLHYWCCGCTTPLDIWLSTPLDIWWTSDYTIGLLATPLDIWRTSDYTIGLLATPLDIWRTSDYMHHRDFWLYH